MALHSQNTQRQLGVVELSLFAMFAALQLCLLNTVAFNHLFVTVWFSQATIMKKHQYFRSNKVYSLLYAVYFL